MKPHPFVFASLAALMISQAHAIVIFGKDNTQNLTSPDAGLPFDGVARVTSADGFIDGGTAVHLGNGFMLTADHIASNKTESITFNGSTYLDRDPAFTPIQIGNTDMRIFKLTTVPTVGAAQLYTGSAELLNEATLIGWGLGRDATEVGTTVVPWGNSTTATKRWGTNQPKLVQPSVSYTASTNGKTYTFDSLITVAGSPSGTPSGLGSDEAAITLFDSGAPLFQEIDGTWYLTGLTSVLSQQSGSNTSTFGNDNALVAAPNRGDLNYFVRVSPYAAQINTLVPEPSSLLLSALSLPLLLRRRR